MHKKKKTISYLAIAGLSVGAMFQLTHQESDYSLINASVLGIFENIAEENRPAPADLAITNVTIKKVADPKDYFNYYRYKADVEITNLASDLKNASLTIRSKDSVEKTLGPDFNLTQGESFMVKDFEVLFDGNYNSGEIEIELVRTDEDEYYKKNNIYQVPVFELKTVNDFEAIDVLNGDFDSQMELMFGESLNARDYQYKEILIGDEIVSFYEIKNSRAVIEDSSWKVASNYAGEPGYVYLRKTDPETGNYAVSNIWRFFENKKLSRAQFAKLFVEYAGVELAQGGVDFFEDVDYGADFGPYIRTVYNLGLMSGSGPLYFPDAPATRAEVLAVVMDYFDVDLKASRNSEYDEPYLQALQNSELGDDFLEPFEPEATATEAYLKNLINGYKKAN